MPQFPNDIPSLSEVILNWTFREKGAIFIPKDYRKEAVIMQIDIKIVSVSREQYLSYKSSPASSFYGYATLIMRDFALPPIKIIQPRQTLYYGKVEDAMVGWWNFYRSIVEAEKFKGIESLICNGVIPPLGGSCEAKPCVPIVPPSWVELPLREVYIKSDFGTQFQLELSYWKYAALLDNCGNLVTNDSGQNDGDKDDGLPANGTQPSNASNPNNPYAGLPSPSTPQDSPLGLLDPSKQDGLDGVGLDNYPEDDGRLYWVKVRVGLTNINIGCNRRRVSTYHYPIQKDEFVTVIPDPTVPDVPTGCGDTIQKAFALFGNYSNSIVGYTGWIYPYNVGLFYESGFALPPDTQEFEGS